MLKLEIAIRYLRSRKSHSVVNLISIVVLFSISITIASTILVVSLQRGLIGYVDELYSSFDSQLRISSQHGRYFDVDSILIQTLDSNGGIVGYSRTLEGEVLLENRRGIQQVAVLRGVDSIYSEVLDIAQRVTHGEYQLLNGDIEQVVMGQGLAFGLSINPSLRQWITIYAMTSAAPTMPSLMGGLSSNITRMEAQPSAIFAMDEQTDSRYLFSSLGFAQRLFRRGGTQVSSIELRLAEGVSVLKVQRELKAILGDGYIIATREQQRAALFRIMNIERWIIFAILSMICAIATLSLSGALIMMISEKKIQSRTLMQLGYLSSDIRSLFTTIGIVITALGAIFGVIIGSVLVWVQSTFGVLKLGGGGSMLLDAYPVILSPLDIVLTLSIALVLGSIISLITTRSLRFE